MNSGTIRTEKSDSFCFGSCADKSIIYTDELWFSKENVEQAKCILEGTKVLVNVKHQSERLIERTPVLSTSNSDIWNVVPHEEEPLKHRMIIYKTRGIMENHKEWSICKINPLMWLTIWREHIDSVLKNTYMKSLIVTRKPKRSSTYSHKAIDTLSPAKRLKTNTTEDIIEITPSTILSQSQELFTTPQPIDEYVASPSWVIPDTPEEEQNSIPKNFLQSLLNDPFVEPQCKFDENQPAQCCVNHGTNFHLCN